MTSSKGNISALLALCAANSPITGEFLSQKPATRSFDVLFICAWINGWVNIREAGDLRRHCAHYDVTLMHENVIVWVILFTHILHSCVNFNWQSCNSHDAMYPLMLWVKSVGTIGKQPITAHDVSTYCLGVYPILSFDSPHTEIIFSYKIC